MDSIGNDMVMINSHYKSKYDDDDDQSVNSDDSSVDVVYRNDDPPFFDDNKLKSLSTASFGDGSPLELREDIIETKGIPARLKDVLNFNDELKLHEVEEQMKARENIDRDMEKEIQNILNMETHAHMEDKTLLDAAFVAREKAKEVREVAKNGKTTLKRAMEIMEVALPPFLIACAKSYEKNDLSLEFEKEYQKYEDCLIEKRKATIDFDLVQKKSAEAFEHLGRCIDISKEEERRMAEKKRIEIAEDRTKKFSDAKKEMNDIIKSELDEVHSCLRSCNSDLNNIENINCDQEKRFNHASLLYSKGDKTYDMKINVNRQNQKDLRAQLDSLLNQERLLVERRKLEQEIQGRANKWNNSVCVQMAELKDSISNIKSCATTSLKVMELMKEGGINLLAASMTAEEQYISHLKDIDIEAKTRWRNILATDAVEKKLIIDNSTINVDAYKEKYKILKAELNMAAQLIQKVNYTSLKAELEKYKEEIKEEKKKKKIAEEQLNNLMESIVKCDEVLYHLGRDVDSVDKMFEDRKREVAKDCANDFSSIDFSQDEDSDDD